MDPLVIIDGGTQADHNAMARARRQQPDGSAPSLLSPIQRRRHTSERLLIFPLNFCGFCSTAGSRGKAAQARFTITGRFAAYRGHAARFAKRVDGKAPPRPAGIPSISLAEPPISHPNPYEITAEESVYCSPILIFLKCRIYTLYIH